MAITTQGYDGAAFEIDEVGWAQIAGFYGAEYAVAGLNGAPDENAGRVTTVTSADRTVAVAPAVFYGHGVLDRSDSTVNVQLPAVAAGTARWFLVAVRRNWQTNSTTVAALTATQVQPVIPPQRLNTPGVEDDQPLALVQVTAGQSIPTAVVDLRCWAGNAGVVGASDGVRSYLTRLGTQLMVGAKMWTRLLSNTGSPVWASHEHSASEVATGVLGIQRIPAIPAGYLTGVIEPSNLPPTRDFHVRTTGVTVGLGGTTRTVQFPAGWYVSPPVVQLTVGNQTEASNSIRIAAGSVTKDSMTYTIRNDSSSGQTCTVNLSAFPST